MTEFQELIQHMKNCGWEETCVMGDTYVIINPKVTDEKYESWLSAMKSCIEVASEA